MDRRIPREEWANGLHRFTNRNAGRITVLEVSGSEIGVQQEEVEYPLRGIAYDRRDDRIDIMLGDQRSVDRHLTHTVVAPETVDLLMGEDGRDHALRIVHEDAETLLRFPIP
jgi:hypothetical protein